MAENCKYKRLVLDPRCLKPFYEVQDNQIYTDALDAIDQAINHKYTTESEKKILLETKSQVKKNKYNY